MTQTIAAMSPELIAARIERLPVSPWHTRIRLILGTATFFDAFDVLAIAFVMPVLAQLWKLTPPQIGLLISAGYAGQVLGAMIFGALAERLGRIRTLNLTIVIISMFGFACAFAPSYWVLIVLRFLQGIGLGGELPVAATYINEIAKTHRRGRFVLLFQAIFPAGFLAAALASVLVVPTLGWQWMFVIGAIPAFLIIPIRRHVPESPRWLARIGRLEKADEVLSQIEKQVSQDGRVPLPPIPTSFPKSSANASEWKELFRSSYAKRTIALWVMWSCSGAISYGLQTWLPTFLSSVYKMSVRDALGYNLVGYVILLAAIVACALFIDRVGRRRNFLLGFLVATAILIVLWMIAERSTGPIVWALAMLTATFNGIIQLAFWLYAPEIYPTRMRALGVGWASACSRIAAMIMPAIVGVIIHAAGLSVVFLVFAVLGFVGFITAFSLAIETKDRLLEEISP